jgi:6-phosphogluconolactonase/glucosamine-6-phosphate isomerase/deaminase
MRLVTSNDDQQVVQYLTSYLMRHLREGKSVLWLVPGGSAMKSAVKVLHNLEDDDTSRLCITLTDERYGQPDHPDENWQQLRALGFDVRSINAYRVLRGETIQQTAQDFDHILQQMCATLDVKIGLFGIGADGHTAGIKPHTSAVSAHGYAAHFTGEDYERVTMTPEAIRHLDLAVVYAMGEDKHEQIQRLLHSDVSVAEQPAQCLKLARELVIFSDYSE